MEADAPLRAIMMGFSSPVNIWHWQADKDIQFWEDREAAPTIRSDFRYPFEQEEILSVTTPELKSAVADMLAQRAGSLTNKTVQRVQGRGLWNGGSWSVVFSRSLTTDDSQFDCQFPWGQRLAAFAVWDGDQDQRGGRKSMSQWVTLQIEKPAGVKAAHSKPSDADVHTEGLSWMDRISSFSLLSSAHASSAENRPNLSDAESRVITIEAKRFEYVPNRIFVRKGEVVTLRMESLDVTHGLYLDGYGVNIKANPGVVAKATFVADKPGRFTFRCSETCGEFHPYMIGFLEVTPNRRFNLFLLAIGAAFVVILGVLLLRPQQEKGAAENAGTE
jgi:heme/copper-type cytochrome/quinol oxidase subunit 2